MSSELGYYVKHDDVENPIRSDEDDVDPSSMRTPHYESKHEMSSFKHLSVLLLSILLADVITACVVASFVYGYIFIDDAAFAYFMLLISLSKLAGASLIKRRSALPKAARSLVHLSLAIPVACWVPMFVRVVWVSYTGGTTSSQYLLVTAMFIRVIEFFHFSNAVILVWIKGR